MPGDFIELRGADGFLKLSKALKQAGQTELRKQLHKGMRDAVNAYKPKAEEALQEKLPSGLKARGKVRQRVQVKTGRDPGVSVVVPYGVTLSRGAGLRSGLAGSNARLLNKQGRLRHPTFGREPWVTQVVNGSTGWFDDVWRDSAPAVRRELERQIQSVLDDIAREAGRG